jgi:hypothetical protein
MTAAGLPRRAVLAYGALGLPLAFAALPLYVPCRGCTEALGLPLAGVGGAAAAAGGGCGVRPLIGWANDRFGAGAVGAASCWAGW